MKSVFTTINTALRRAGLAQRFIRGKGYYYVTDVACSSGYYGGMVIAPTEANLKTVRDHVNTVLAEEGIHFHINEQNVCERHPMGYTGHIRSCTATTKEPLSLDQWRRTIHNPALQEAAAAALENMTKRTISVAAPTRKPHGMTQRDWNRLRIEAEQRRRAALFPRLVKALREAVACLDADERDAKVYTRCSKLLKEVS